MLRRGEMLYSGFELESDVVGECTLKPEAYEKLARVQRDNGYVPYGEAVRWIREFYTGDPTDPPARFANDLHFTTAEILAAADKPQEDEPQLRYYSAVKTPLDFYHGVDGFFVWREAIATIDVTKNPTKEGGYKADVIISGDPQRGENENQEQYLERLQGYAQEIAKILIEKEKLKR